jgi:hypothetical protein
MKCLTITEASELFNLPPEILNEAVKSKELAVNGFGTHVIRTTDIEIERYINSKLYTKRMQKKFGLRSRLAERLAETILFNLFISKAPAG